MINSSTHKKQKNSKVIAVCYAGSNIEYQTVMVDALAEYAETLNFKLIFFASFNEKFSGTLHDIGELNIYNLPNFNMFDGLIIFSETLKDERTLSNLIERAEAAGKPVISIDRFIENCYNIIFDYSNALETMIRHFIEHHKFKRINFVAGKKGNLISEERLLVYKNILTEYGIQIEEDRIIYGDFWYFPTYQAMGQFFNNGLEEPEVIICANDSMAIAAYDYLQEHNYKVPEDICVSGIDGISEALHHFPRFTTACQNFKGASILAIDILKDIFEEKEVEKLYKVESKMLYSQTCGCEDMPLFLSNKYLRKMVNEINEINVFSKDLIYMSSNLSVLKNMDEVVGHMQEYIKKIYTTRLWICTIDNFIENETSLEDIFNREKYYRTQYSKKMRVLIYREFDEIIPIGDFKSENMLPNWDKALEDCNNILFMPLHFQDKTIGYMAMEFEPPIGNLNNMHSFVMNLANVFETVRTQSELKTIIQKLEEMYIHDHLTGLFNRRGFYLQIVKKLEENPDSNIMIVSIDLDGLKYINDTFGHNEGDNAIKTVAKTLLSSSAKGEICARFGGDEFVVAGIGNIDIQYMEEYFSGFNKMLEYYNKHSDKGYQVRASCGMIIEKITPEINIDSIIKLADEKMYKLKHSQKRKRGNRT